jgi:hypothetical protein
LAGVAAALAVGGVGCAKSIQGTALVGASVATQTTTTGGGLPTGGTSSAAPTGGNGGDLSQKAQETCSQLPKDAVANAFGVTGVNVTTGGGKTLNGGVIQITCVITASGFGASVVVQVYPSTSLSTPQQYAQIMGRQYTVTPITVNGADVAGTFQQPVSGQEVDEAYAAKKDTASNTVDVVLAGVPDSPGIGPKLINFLTALASN